ncbi:MAG: hypothetical protein ACFFDN_00005 [Candidatus Hodarchaeota archaeon]
MINKADLQKEWINCYECGNRMELRLDRARGKSSWNCPVCGWILPIEKMTKEEKQEMRKIKAEICKTLKEANFPV